MVFRWHNGHYQTRKHWLCFWRIGYKCAVAYLWGTIQKAITIKQSRNNNIQSNWYSSIEWQIWLDLFKYIYIWLKIRQVIGIIQLAPVDLGFLCFLYVFSYWRQFVSVWSSLCCQITDCLERRLTWLHDMYCSLYVSGVVFMIHACTTHFYLIFYVYQWVQFYTYTHTHRHKYG